MLALVNATAEWHAGLPGACSASVRLLDRVHFTVHRGDCVVVHHDDPASARVLLAALGGDGGQVLRRQLHGYRHCASGVRIRRCSIPTGAVAALQSGWTQRPSDGAIHADGPLATQSVVHLMRASRYVAITRHERTQWIGWAHHVRATGGALVIVAPGTLHRAPSITAPPRPGLAAGTTLREPVLAGYAAVEAPARTQALWLHHGRLCHMRTWE